MAAVIVFKYPLSIVGCALDMLGPCLLIGYDIGCKLTTTIKSSPLATKFEDSKNRNRPNIIEGVDLKDLSTMEHIFSASNQLTSVTRYATTCNCRLFINMYFWQWDKDKYVNLGKMLYNNYPQALCIVNDSGLALQQAKISLQIDDKDIQAFQVKQSKYLETLGLESE
ncbi:hypothetical protein JVU11DRAFT_7229 [Chiua virens]|nr:hypothetical protein JVU11DRAFT_7229 [Chiua virens]